MSLRHEGVKPLLCSVSQNDATSLRNTCLHYKAYYSFHSIFQCVDSREKYKVDVDTRFVWVEQLAYYICLLAVYVYVCMSPTETILINI